MTTEQTKNYLSARDISDMFDVGYRTAWRLLKKYETAGNRVYRRAGVRVSRKQFEYWYRRPL